MSDARPTDYLAAERTFLAWIRTGLALMSLGFVVARFGLFLQALQLGPSIQTARPYGPSFWFGTAFIVLGVVVNVISLRNHLSLVEDLKRGGTSYTRPSRLAIGVAAALALAGVAMAIYLISFPRSNDETRKEKTMTSHPDSGIVTRRSNHSVEQTVQKLEAILQAKGVKLFALVDHSGEAERAGLQMRPTKLLIFGNPKGGTPLMVAAPTTAIDLPLKVLIWQDSDDAVWVSYNSPAYLQSRHGFPQELVQNIAVVESLAAAAAE
jgi:uncharacterized protein (DUF302 family)/uncharacterized membrane protein YidH (DUF202 family)